jgi:hypothetical protein
MSVWIFGGEGFHFLKVPVQAGTAGRVDLYLPQESFDTIFHE